MKRLYLACLLFVSNLCANTAEIILESIPQHVDRAYKSILNKNLAPYQFFQIIELLSVQGRIMNELIISAEYWNKGLLNKVEDMLPSEALQTLGVQASVTYNFLSDDVKIIFNDIENTGNGLFIFDNTLTCKSLCNFLLLEDSRKSMLIREGFYDLLHFSFSKIFYDPQDSYVCSLFHVTFLIKLYQKLLLYASNQTFRDAGNYQHMRPFFLPIYQLTWYAPSNNHDTQKKLMLLLYATRLRNIMSRIEKVYEYSFQVKKQNLHYFNRLKHYVDLLYPVQTITYKKIIDHVKFTHGYLEMRDAITDILYHDRIMMSDWVDFHLVRLAHAYNKNINEEFVLCTLDTLKEKIIKDHSWMCRLCKFIVQELSELGIPIDDEANLCAEELMDVCSIEHQNRQCRSKNLMKTKKTCLENNLNVENNSKDPEIVYNENEEELDDVYITSFRNYAGKIFTHFQDEEVIPEGSVEKNICGFIQQDEKFALLYDNNRLAFGGNATLIALFGTSKDKSVHHLLSSMDYSYLREKNKKITHDNDNNHSFTEWVERQYGYWGSIRDEGILTKEQKEKVKHYEMEYTRYILIDIPMRITRFCDNVSYDDIRKDGAWGKAEFLLYLTDNANDTPLCMHRFYKPRKNKQRNEKRRLLRKEKS